MFVEKLDGAQQAKPSWKIKLASFWSNKKALRLTGFVLLAVMAFGLLVMFWLASMNRNKLPKTDPANGAAISQLPNLEVTPDSPTTAEGALLSKAETLLFGNFYHPLFETAVPKTKGLALPTNIKQQAANYYPIDRQISLEPYFEAINKNGFVIIDNPFAGEAKDFYGVYTLLINKNLPFIITNDFLLYYYQNSLKNIFKSIEADVFYKEAWEINKQMFGLADQRYREHYAKVGVLNDPVLEGLRLEAVYFGTMLEILKPKDKQILSESKNSVQNKDYYTNFFSDQEGQTYNFTPPAHLAETISQEIALIDKGIRNNQASRSPAFLYDRNYRDFAVPKEYQGNAKLHNFYLSSLWAESLFPLFYRDDSCADCLLDKEDWTINQAAAHLIARDFAANQALKNRWAKVYKALSFINNLRTELTYLDYNQAFVEMFGDPNAAAAQQWLSGDKSGPAPFKTVEEVFDFANADRDKNLLALRDKVAAKTFAASKGGLNRQSAEGQMNSGLRLLQSSFDPTRYVYDQLVYDQVGPALNFDTKVKDAENVTACAQTNAPAVRCRAFSLDIINAVFDEPIKSGYFIKNTDYKSYGNQAPLIRNHFNGFDAVAWHDNLYWTSLDLVRHMLNNRRLTDFPYTQGDGWTEYNLGAASGAVLNAQFPVDSWSLAIKKDPGTAPESNIITYSYAEPNLTLLNELLADTQMVFDVFVGLDLVKSNNSDFNQMLADFNNLKNLQLKELAGEDFYFKDWAFLNEFVSRYYLTNSADKAVSLVFPVPNNRQSKVLKQSIDGVKLMVAVYHHQNRDLIAVGPIFNFNEVGN